LPVSALEAVAGPATGAPPEPPERRLRDFCRKSETASAVDETRRVLEQTFCTATLWFDGLFGEELHVENARAVSGRVEVSDLYTEFDGNTPKGRLRLRYDLPNLDRRVNVFLGRDTREEFIADRREGFALRSSIFGIETEENWLAGLGYAPPGRYSNKVDFRVGGRVREDPVAFAQARFRQNVFVGDRTVWRFRETFFYETSSEGFGETTSIDVDHVIRRDLLFRFGTAATWTEATEGLYWRHAFVLYHDLREFRAIAGELFVRGATDAPVEVKEYGARLIYRFPLKKPSLFLEVVGGYSWPRIEEVQPREGSAMAGVGLELLFGQDPF
jgi:hypothetical protein